MATLTTVYSFFLPVIGGDIDVWGGMHNDNFEKLDDLLSGTGTITPNLGAGWEVGGVAVTANAAELNILDGATLSVSELNALDGYTGTTADLNILSGAAAAGLTATELLYLNGVTSAIQSQLNDKQPLDAALTSLAGLTLAANRLIYATAADTLAAFPLGVASTGLHVKSDGSGFEWAFDGRVLTLDTTAGDTIAGPWDLPAGIKKFAITSDKSSIDGTGHFLVQLRVAGVWITTGYDCYSLRGSSTNISGITSGMVVAAGADGAFWQGAMTFWLHDPTSDYWVQRHDGSTTTTASDVVNGSGSINLSGPVDGVRVTTTNGDNFDTVSFNVHY